MTKLITDIFVGQILELRLRIRLKIQTKEYKISINHWNIL